MISRNAYVRPTRALIHTATLEKNWNALKNRIPSETQILAIVKANAYGHGSVPMALTCQGLGAVGAGVADIVEAIVLREGGYQGLILCLGDVPKQALFDALESKVILTLHTMEQFAHLEEAAKKYEKKITIHLKIDSGMNRLGFQRKSWDEAARHLASAPYLNPEGIFTHLADSDNPDREFTKKQIQDFNEAVGIFEKAAGKRLIRHAANSGGILHHPQAHFDWVRPGIALYGYPPSSDEETAGSFEPALEWRAPIVEIKAIAPGDTVGYNRRFKAEKPMTVAIVAAGYGDGFRRAFAQAGVGFRGKRCAILGIVCMDLLMIDITGFARPSVYEEVTLLGPVWTGARNAQELAEMEKTIPYEILTGISARVGRDYIAP